MKPNHPWKSLLTTFHIVVASLSGIVVADNHALIAWDDLEAFKSSSTDQPSVREYRIPIPLPGFEVREMVPSWNLENLGQAKLEVVLEATFPASDPVAFHLGHWTNEKQSLQQAGARKSVNDQNKAYGVVYTDTLVIKQRPKACLAKLRLVGVDTDAPPRCTFFGISMSGPKEGDGSWKDSGSMTAGQLDVPKLCQLDYEGGNVWCSPTSVTMILAYWAKQLHRPELHYTVPEVASRVFDPAWPGTGNWPFNTAFAGSHEGVRAFVTRLNSLQDLQSLLKAGIPIATSVSYDLLKGKDRKGANDGHLVVCLGFNEQGDPIFNDPARCPEVRTSYPLDAFLRAWHASRRTVYVIHPKDFTLPEGILRRP